MADTLKTTLIVSITAAVEIDTGPWSDETKWGQVRRQAQEAVSHWQIMLKEGTLEPRPIRGAVIVVTKIAQHTKTSDG